MVDASKVSGVNYQNISKAYGTVDQNYEGWWIGDLFEKTDPPFENVSPDGYPSIGGPAYNYGVELDGATTVFLSDIIEVYFKTSDSATAYFSCSLDEKNFTSWSSDLSDSSVTVSETGDKTMYIGYSESPTGPELIYVTITLNVQDNF